METLAGAHPTISALFPETQRRALEACPLFPRAEEIRLRVGREAEVCRGEAVQSLGFRPTRQLLLSILQNAAKKSLYAYEEQLKNGFITIEGGHRIGFCGRVHRSGDSIVSIDNFTSLNIRIAREVKGASRFIYPHATEKKRPVSSLIVSPPGIGKTTALRDLAREISDSGYKVGIIDERCEIACCLDGEPTLDVGRRSDVLDNCPKAAGVLLLVRTMSPDAIVTDEIGGKADFDAIFTAVTSGIAVLATAHARDMQELRSKPYMEPILESGLFERYIFISRKNGDATVSAVYGPDLSRR